jgi:hypothetical protein
VLRPTEVVVVSTFTGRVTTTASKTFNGHSYGARGGDNETIAGGLAGQAAGTSSVIITVCRITATTAPLCPIDAASGAVHNINLINSRLAPAGCGRGGGRSDD